MMSHQALTGQTLKTAEGGALGTGPEALERAAERVRRGEGGGLRAGTLARPHR